MTLYAAHAASTPATDINPAELERLLVQAMERDDPDAVLRLLDGVDALEFGISALHEAAGRDSVRVAQALLDAGFDANLGVDKPLHMAARYERQRRARSCFAPRRSAMISTAMRATVPCAVSSNAIFSVTPPPVVGCASLSAAMPGKNLKMSSSSA